MLYGGESVGGRGGVNPVNIFSSAVLLEAQIYFILGYCIDPLSYIHTHTDTHK